MGGLVARAMIAERPDLWRRMLARGGRLVMLGTPNRGSWEIVRLLVAQAATLKQLALLDVTKDRSELLAIVCDFPGVLELLPEDARDFFTDGIWRSLRAHDEEQWGLPGQGRPAASRPTWLTQAREARGWLRDRAIDPEGMIYVAGQAPETASDVVQTSGGRWPWGNRKRLAFFVSRRGDSSVLWDDGVLPGVPTWYAPGIGHGDLAKDRSIFNAIEDLLEQGRTEARVLQREAPVSRGEDVPREMADREPAYYPDEDMLVRTALAISPPRPRVSASLRTVSVSVTHGSVGFVANRVAVGSLRGRQYRRRRGLSGPRPGRSAHGPSCTVALSGIDRHPCPVRQPRSAGQAARGTGGRSRGCGRVDVANAHGHLRPLLACAGPPHRRAPGFGRRKPAGGPQEIALSCLLIGAGAGGVGVQESVLALLRGVADANRTLEQAVRSTVCVLRPSSSSSSGRIAPSPRPARSRW